MTVRVRGSAGVLGLTLLAAGAGWACGSSEKPDSFASPSAPATWATAAAATTVPAPAATATSKPAPPTPTSVPAGPTCAYLSPGTTFTVTLPAADVPAALAAYSGAWEGLWGGSAASPSALIVRSVTATRVEATYVFQGVASVMNMNVTAARPAGPLTFGDSVLFTWTLSPDGTRLGGTRTSAGQASSVTMNRCRLP